MDEAFWRQLFLFLHVLGAIVALGFSLTYGLELQPGQPPLTGGRIATSSPSATGVARDARSPFTTNDDTSTIAANRSP